MATVQLLGRGTYGPEVSMDHPLWSFFKSPPAQNSVVVYTDGHVTEAAIFSVDDINADVVNTYIQGGTDFRTEVGSFLYDSLTAAGYTWRNVTARDAYSDNYEDVY
jgi:hypothetical protein